MQLKTIVLTTSALLETHTLFILSLLICRMGTLMQRAPQAAWKASPTPQGPGKNVRGVISSVLGRRMTIRED